MLGWIPLRLWLQARRVRLARWALRRLVIPAAAWLNAQQASAAAMLAEDHDLPRMRMGVCQRCPVFDKGWCSRDRGGCGCYMPVKTRMAGVSCPQGKW